MNNLQLKLIITLCLTLLFNFAHAKGEDKSLTLRSPSKEVRIDISWKNQELTYEIYFGETLILQPSKLKWKIGETELGKSIQQVQLKKGNKIIQTSYPLLGNHATAHNRYQTAEMTISEIHGQEWKIELRAYDTGIAFRYLTESEKSSVSDLTTFCLPAGKTCWLQSNAKYYEAPYKAFPTNNLPEKVVAGPPVTIRYGNKIYAAISEGGLKNFGGMGLEVISPNCFRSHLEGQTILEGHIATPWRILMIGNLNSLVNNDIITDVSDPLSPIFKNDISWIEPGNCVWSWLAGYSVSLENMKRFTDWGAELGIKYNLVDEGWSHWEDKEHGKDCWDMVAELVNYSKSKGVKILLWKAYPDRKGIEGIQTSERRRRFFQKCKDLGVAGLKIDFFDCESQTVTRYYEETLKEAAEFGLVINFHGSNKPTGLNRTYPNELNREGILGLEYGESSAQQNVLLPFTRYLAGHGDYTPLPLQREWMGGTSEAHQIATTALFTSPLRCYGGRPEDYLKHPAKNLFLNIPTTWDETRVLSGSEIGECVITAHRKGNVWYVAALTNKACKHKIDLSFLSKGKWQAEIVSDAGNQECRLSKTSFTRTDVLPISMVEKGGFLARFSQQGDNNLVQSCK